MRAFFYGVNLMLLLAIAVTASAVEEAYDKYQFKRKLRRIK